MLNRMRQVARPASTTQRLEPIAPDTPPDLHTAIVRDYLGHTESARHETLIKPT